MTIGTDVLLNSPYGELSMGNPDCSLAIKNGAKGHVIGAPRGAEYARVLFDAFSDRVTVNVPIHWLERR